MLTPSTRAVEKRESATVKRCASRITSMAAWYEVTSQPPSAGIHETGSRSRRRASSGCGSSSSSSTVTLAPSGNCTQAGCHSPSSGPLGGWQPISMR